MLFLTLCLSFVLLLLQLGGHLFLFLLRERTPVDIFSLNFFFLGLLGLLCGLLLLVCFCTVFLILSLVSIFLDSHFFGFSLPLLWQFEVPDTLLDIVFNIGVVVASVRTTSMDNDGFELIVDEIRVLLLRLGLIRLLKVLTYVELQGVFEALVDFDPVPCYHIVLDTRQVQGQNRWQTRELRTLGHSARLFTLMAMKTLDLFWLEEHGKTFTDTLDAINEKRQVEKLFRNRDSVVAVRANDIRVADTEEHLLNERIIHSIFQRCLDGLE